MIRSIFSMIRYAQALALLILCFNSIYEWLPMPTMPWHAQTRLEQLAQAPYFFPMLLSVTILGALLLFMGKRIGWSLVMLTPIIIYYFVFSLYYHPSHLSLPMILLLHHLLLCIYNRDSFSSLSKEAKA